MAAAWSCGSYYQASAKADGREGRPFCARTADGGRTWEFVGWIGDEPAGYAIMPSTVRLGPDRLLTAVRCREGEKSWIDWMRQIKPAQIPYLTRVLLRTQRMMKSEAYMKEHEEAQRVAPLRSIPPHAVEAS